MRLYPIVVALLPLGNHAVAKGDFTGQSKSQIVKVGVMAGQILAEHIYSQQTAGRPVDSFFKPNRTQFKSIPINTGPG